MVVYHTCLSIFRGVLWDIFGIHLVQFSSVAQSCLTLCNLMDFSMPGFPVHHQLPEPTQTHIHWVSEAIQPSHPLSSPSTLAFNLSQHLGLFPVSPFYTIGGQSIGVSASTSVLPMTIQDWFPLGWTGCILRDAVPCSPRNSQESSPTPQFKSINSSAQLSSQSNSHIHTWPLEKP